MNRSERRKNKKVEKDPVFYIKKSELEQKLMISYQKGYENALKSDAVSFVLTMLLGIPCKVMKEKHGWGNRKRLPRFAEDIMDEYEKLDLNTDSIEQMQEVIYEQTGIRFGNRSDS